MKKKYPLITALSLAIISSNYAQHKPAINIDILDSWNSLNSSNISKSGNYIFYNISPQEGDTQLQLKDNKNNVIYTRQRATSSNLNEGENFLLAIVKPFFKDVRQAKIKKKKADEMPKDSLVIYNLKERNEINLGEIKSYKTAAKFNNHVAFVQELEVKAKSNAPDSTATSNNKSNPKKESVLILKNILTGDTIQLWKADQYYFDLNEKYLVFSKKGPAKDSLNITGLYLHDIATAKTKKISNGKGTYKSITFDDNSNQFVFLADKSPEKSQIKDFKVYLYNNNLDTAQILIEKSSNNIPKQWYISEDATLSFSEDAQKLFFGIAPIPKIKDTTLVDFEHAKVDIWHWQDDYLMTQQLVNINRDRNRSYEAVYHFDRKNLVPLIDENFNRISFTDTANEEWVLSSTMSLENKIASQWDLNTAQDIYLISTVTGERKLIKKDWKGRAQLSPKANFVILYDADNANWISYDIHNNTEHWLNKGTAVNFSNELNDMPTTASAYGIAAWAADESGVYINDRYDIWFFSFNGKIQNNITKQLGRDNRTVLRAINPNRREWRNNTFKIDNKSTIYLTSFNEETKENGIYTLKLSKNSKPTKIIEDKYTFKAIMADDSQKSFIYMKENYTNPADLYLSSDFKKESRLTNINPQQANYNWGTAELVKWTTPNGFDAEGILYKPENFDPNKKYPIIAYFYEALTEGLYTYHTPAPTPSRLMIPYFVSNEYLVFAPDIRYQDGHPGKAAEEYINSGMHDLAKNSWVDESKMAIQGQSWGGYQVAHLITRTDMYAAAWAGAPVVNMTSAYGGIRWSTGMSRQFQYEKTQSRIGATLWENRDLYIENSPLFFLDKVSTPVAIMHNDNDGAVPWYQGIEMFTALRRLQKPVWLLNYNGDEHNLMQRQNRKDIQRRQHQFFDHFLKGKPAAEWIKSGVQAKEKGINWGFDTKNN